ncbi:MAG: hypothetical protein AB1384_09300 [Actinomycetota bacterium]
MIARTAFIFLATVLTLIVAMGCGKTWQEMPDATEDEAGSGTEVPEEYASLYGELETKLGELDTYLEGRSGGENGSTVFSVELVAANSNRGEELFREGTIYAIQATLDSLKELGVGGITLSVQYPVLNPDFPRSSEYLGFYRQVAAEVRSRGLALIVETTTVFPQPEVSPLGVDYSGLTLEEYMREKRAMTETVLRELRPDYLTVENEPMTQQSNTGLAFTVANQTQIVNHILAGLDRAGTRIGAGAGSWDDLAYFESLAANTTVDYLDIHFYPIQGDAILDRAEQVSAIARTHGKELASAESWLYKISGEELSRSETVATAIDTFARDGYSFWAPLDQAYLEVMVELARYLDFAFLSPFWMQYLYGYVEYSALTEDMTYGELQRASGQNAWISIRSGVLSPTGETYKELIYPR